VVCTYVAGLPDGLFSNQKSQFGQILESLGKSFLFYGKFCGRLVYFHRFGIFGIQPMKSFI
jgi:hypothetical protein